MNLSKNLYSNINGTTLFEEQWKRCHHANAFLQILASSQRQFFRHRASGRVASMVVDRDGQVWFKDHANECLMSTSTENGFKGFSSGGNLQNLIRYIAEYIREGTKLEWRLIGLPRADGSTIWGFSTSGIQALHSQLTHSHLIDHESEYEYPTA
ncbi:hypothetical protein AB6D11_00510 [Vibrio splendidus]